MVVRSSFVVDLVWRAMVVRSSSPVEVQRVALAVMFAFLRARAS
jgi:hypothetical protein